MSGALAQTAAGTRQILAAATLAAAMVIGPGNAGVNAAGTPTHVDKHVVLTFGAWMTEQAPALNKIVQVFEAAHPNITVNLQFTPYPTYFSSLQAKTQLGSGPDVFAMNVPNFPLFASHRLLLGLSRLVKRDHIGLGHYPSSTIISSTYKKTLYSIPKDFDVVGLWYNRKMFDAAGLAYPDSSWSWQTLYAAAKKLTNHARGIWGIAAQLKDQEGYYNTMYQAGGYVISKNRKKSGFDDPRSIQGLRFWTDLLRLRYSPPASRLVGSPNGPDPKNTLFESGKVAMIFGGDWLAREFATNGYLRNKVDVAPLPRGVRAATVIQSTSWAISARTRHPAEAWQFLKFLGSARAAYIQADAGFVIPAYLGTQSVWVSTWPQMHLKSILSELNYAVPYPASINSAAWSTMANVYLADVWSGRLALTTAAHIIAGKMNADLRTEQAAR